MLQRIWNRLQKRFRKPKRYYDIDGFVLDMGAHHLLSNYQEDCPMFARFIPYFGVIGKKVRPTGGVIVDLGANVGDTAAAIIKHTNAHLLCIEPTHAYYALLKKNILLLDPQGSRIQTLQAFISEEKQGYQADVSGGGTAVQKASMNPEAPTLFLPEAIEQCGISLESVCLIKTSTSGNDAGAVLSLGDALDDIEPIFYIETDMTMDGGTDVLARQLDSYWRMDSYLEHKGYTCCFIFDNYGNFLCEGTPKTLKDIHRYMYQMALGKSNRTFYYVYLLICRKEHEKICADTVKEYMKAYSGIA